MNQQGSCEAVWVIGGQAQRCGKPATWVVPFDDDALVCCQQCAYDLGDFDLYHVERHLAGERAALESWTGRPA